MNRSAESDWIMNCSRLRALPQPGGCHCREAFIEALITGDPNLLPGGFTDLNIDVGHEQRLRSVLNTFTHLPPQRFKPVLQTGLDTNLAIRQLAKGNRSWFYLATPLPGEGGGNPLYQDGRIRELVSGRRVSVRKTSRGLALTVDVELLDWLRIKSTRGLSTSAPTGQHRWRRTIWRDCNEFRGASPAC